MAKKRKKKNKTTSHRAKKPASPSQVTTLKKDGTQGSPSYDDPAVLWKLGRMDEALEKVSQLLTSSPNDLHVLSQGVHYSVVLGQEEQARAWAETLYSQEASDVPSLATILKGLSYWKEEKKVLRRFEQEDELISLNDETNKRDLAFCYFYAGVAAARLGDDKSAWEYFEQAAEIEPTLPELAENVDDLSNPSKTQEGAWAFPLHEWVFLRMTQKEVAAMAEHALQQGHKSKIERQIQTFWKKYPELQTLIPILLERGSPISRKTMFGLAVSISNDETLGAVEVFAQGRHGTDDMRNGAFWILLEKGLFRQGETITFWKSGQQVTEPLFAFDLFHEPRENDPYQHLISKDAETLFHAGTIALMERRLDEALAVLEQAHKKAPKYPSIMQNLAAIYDRKGNREKAKELLSKAVELHPDYLMGRTQMSLFASQDGDFEKAWEWLEPTLHQVRLHTSEFVSIMDSMLEYLIEQGKKDEAQIWLDCFRDTMPSNPRVRSWESQLSTWVKVRRILMLPFTFIFLILYGLLVLVTGIGRYVIQLVKKI